VISFFFLAEYDAGLHSRDAYLVTLTTHDRLITLMPCHRLD